MLVFYVFCDRGIYFSENAQYERQEKLNRTYFSLYLKKQINSVG